MKPSIEVTVLRSVPVSEDGVTTREIVKGTTDTVPADLFPGLEAEGYVARAKPDQKPADDPTVEEIEIPADWQKLHHLQIIALAKKFDDTVSTKADAVAVINAELAKG